MVEESWLETNFNEEQVIESLIVDVDGYEGPLDVLLTLARSQKVDVRKISVLMLAEQYLKFIKEAKELRIELAADYLVMAAWLAFLKSRLLLPPDPSDENPSGEELAAYLAFQLERLEAMRKCAAKLLARDQLGRNFFPRGIEENIERTKNITYQASLLDLMQAYARIKTKDEFKPFVFERNSILTMEQALVRMRSLIGHAITWSDLRSFLPDGWDIDPKRLRSATASTFAAALELAKHGLIEMEQNDSFLPIKLRKKVE